MGALKIFGRTLVGGCAVITFGEVIGHPAVVCGNSMYPTLEGNDARWWKRDIVWLTSYGVTWGRRKPRVGEIITFISPREPNKIHIKRVSSEPGGVVRPKSRAEIMIVPQNQYWMESDNPQNANDSNVYGPVSTGLMKSRATHVIWPPSRWQRL